MSFPNGRTFPKRCALCPRVAVNLAGTRCRQHWERAAPTPRGMLEYPCSVCGKLKRHDCFPEDLAATQCLDCADRAPEKLSPLGQIVRDALMPTDLCANCAAILEIEREYKALCLRCGNAYNAEFADPDEGDCDEDDESDR